MQIGPRIRIGGSLGKAGDKLKRGVQKVASNPFVQGALGLATGGATVPFLAGTLGGVLKEKAQLGDVVKGAASGYGAGTLGKGARALGSSLFSHGADAAVSAVPSAATAAPEIGGFSEGVASTVAPEVASPVAAPNFLDRVGSGLKKVGTFAEKHPNATAGALNAIGSLVPSRLEEAQARRLEQQIGESDYDFHRRQANETEYDKLWNPLGTAIGSSLSGNGGVAKNPYVNFG